MKSIWKQKIMKTIFDYNPTDQELKKLFSFNEKANTMAYGFSIIPLPVDKYEANSTSESKMLDLAILFELRGLGKEANEIWAKIPEIERQYRCGVDDKQVSI